MAPINLELLFSGTGFKKDKSLFFVLSQFSEIILDNGDFTGKLFSLNML